MKSLIRRFRRNRRLAQLAGRRRELEAELGAFLHRKVKLKPVAVKGGGGYDEIFLAHAGDEHIAVVRVSTNFKEPDDAIGSKDLAIPQAGKQRLEREWEAYQQLSPHGLSPKPLWRTHDAIACSWLPGERASVLLTRSRDDFWPLFHRALAATRRMHDAGVVHLDLNLGNLIVPPRGDSVTFIDFEFGPATWASHAQQLAYDYLRLIEDCVKPRRGGRMLLSDLAQLQQLLAKLVPTEAREAKMGFVFEKFERLAAQPELCERLQTVFKNLRA